MRIRKQFPQVYQLEHSANGRYWQVCARSKKWGLNERKCFRREDEALDYARSIEANILDHGKQPNVPPEKLKAAIAYEELAAKISAHGKTPEDAVAHYLTHLANDLLRKSKPFIRDLVDQWKVFKGEDTTLSQRTVVEIRSYARFIRTTWGELKPDDLKRNDIDVLLKRKTIRNITRRKYLLYVRMFFSWVKDEGHILQNPTDGIFYKPGDYNGEFYSPTVTKQILRYVVDHEPDLIGYYALLTFAGLRPTEGARVKWEDYTFKTNELYVRKGKTNARYITLPAVAAEWMKFHRDHTNNEKPFIDLCSLGNREKRVRAALGPGKWVQDGLRHGFGTYYKSQVKNIYAVADFMGNSPEVVKRHYARTVPEDDCRSFWALSPQVVMADNTTKIDS